MGGTVLMRSPEGTTREVPEDQVKFATDRGFTPLADEAATAASDANTGDAVTSALTGAASGLTLGLSDLAIKGIANQGGVDYVREARAAHSTAGTVGNIVGALIPAVATGGASAEASGAEIGAELAAQGAREGGALEGGALDSLGAIAANTPSGAVSRQAAALAAEGEGAGALTQLGAHAVGGAYEGAAQMAGQYISDVALGNRDLSAEGFVGAVSTGALLGGTVGAGMYGAGAVGGKAMTSVRRLFPAHEMTKDATEAAEGAFRDQLDQVMKDADEIEKTARQRMDEIRLEKMQNDSSVAKRMGELRVEQAEARVAAQKEVLGTRQAQRAAAEAKAAGRAPALPEAAVGAEPSLADHALEAGQDVAETKIEDALAPDAQRIAGAPLVEPPTALERQLAATKNRLDQGAQLGDLSNGVDDAARAADHRVMSATEGKIQQTIDDHIASGDAEFRQLRDTVEGLNKRKSAVQDWVDKLRKPEPEMGLAHPRERYFAGFVDDAGHELDAGYEEALDRAAYASGKGERAAATKEAADLERQIFDKVAQGGGEQAERLKATMRARADANEDFLTIAQKRVVKREGQITGAVDSSMKTTSKTRLMAADLGAPKLDAEYDAALDGAMRAGSAEERTVAMRNAADIEDRVLKMADDAGGAAGQRAAEIRRLRARTGYTGIKAARDRIADLDAGMQTRLDYGVGGLQNQAAIDRFGMRDAIAKAAKGGVDAEPATLMARAAPSNVEDIADAVKVVGGFEGAVHDAMQHVQSMVPLPGAEASARGYAEALARKEAATTTHATQAAEASAEALGNPAARTAVDAVAGKAPLDRTMDLAQQLDEHAATARAAKTVKDGASKLKKEVGGAKAAPEGEPSLLERVGGYGKKAKDIATVIETLHMLGVPGVPDPGNIPVVGPLLGMYLKARAAATVFRRLGGKVPATADTAIASAQASARTKALAAVQRAIDVGGGVAKRAQAGAIPVASKILSQRLLDIGTDAPAKGDKASPVERRLAELADYQTNRDSYLAQVTRSLPTSDPAVAKAVADAVDRNMQFLADKAPKDPRPPSLVKGQWVIPPSQVDAFARYVRAVQQPMTVLEDLSRGRVTPEAAEALRVCYPQMFAEAQKALVTKAPEMIANLRYEARSNIGTLFRVPLDQTQTPSYRAWIASTSGAGSSAGTSQPGSQPAPGTPPQPGIAADVSLSQSAMTSLDRRAQR